MKRIECKYCGVAHDCAGRMSNAERARHAAAVKANMGVTLGENKGVTAPKGVSSVSRMGAAGRQDVGSKKGEGK